MTRRFPFALTVTPNPDCPFSSAIVPSQGEDFGSLLAVAAEAQQARLEASHPDGVVHWGEDVAQIYELAAQAFEHGANASIGHNRTARYRGQAYDLRLKAIALLPKEEG